MAINFMSIGSKTWDQVRPQRSEQILKEHGLYRPKPTKTTTPSLREMEEVFRKEENHEETEEEQEEEEDGLLCDPEEYSDDSEGDDSEGDDSEVDD